MSHSTMPRVNAPSPSPICSRPEEDNQNLSNEGDGEEVERAETAANEEHRGDEGGGIHLNMVVDAD